MPRKTNWALIGLSVLIVEKMFEYFDNMHVYCPGVGEDEPLEFICPNY